MRASLVGAALVATTGLFGQPLVAQETLNLSILNAGKPPATPVTVQAVDRGQVRTIGTTDAAGNIRIAPTAAGFAPGTRVKACRCQDDDTVTIVPADQPCPGEGQDDRRSCVPLAYWAWGGQSRLVMELQNPALTPPRTAFADAPMRFGATLNFNNFTKAEEVAEDALGVTSAGADASSIGFGGHLDWQLRDKPLGLRLGVNYGSYSVTQQGVGFEESRADVSVWSVGLGPRFSLPFGPVEIAPWAMGYWFFNSVDIDTRFGPGDIESASRDESGLRLGVGVDGVLALTRALGLLGRFGYYVGDSPDADTHLQFGLGLEYRLIRGGF